MNTRFAIFSLLFALSAFGQVPSAEITGTVTDTTGGLISGATVAVTNNSTTQRSLETNSPEFITHLRCPGNYSVRVSKPGFRAEIRNSIELQVDQVARLDFALQVGNVSETLEVNAAVPVSTLKRQRSALWLKPGGLKSFR